VTYFELLLGYQQLPGNKEKIRGTARRETEEPQKFGHTYFFRDCVAIDGVWIPNRNYWNF
jgi:hypothetical protein